MGPAQKALFDALGEEMGQRCAMRDVLHEVRCMQDLLGGSLELGGLVPPDTWWWFMAAFLTPAELGRIKRAGRAVRRVFLNLARLNKVITGRSTALPEPLIRALEMAVAEALHETTYNIATGAEDGAAGAASRRILRGPPEESWLVRL